jgi:hypothetical protein
VITFAPRSLRTVLLTLALYSVLSASAGAFTEPGITGTWADFANCPARTIVVFESNECEHSYTTGGVVQVGHSTVPISVPGDTLDVGISLPESAGERGVAFAGQHGILNGPDQPVPGGLLGAIGNVQLTGVKAKLEWAAAVPSDGSFGFTENCGPNPLVTFDACKIINGKPGTAVTLSAKIHLISPFLGSTCYIGSAAHPIVIALTTGTTNPPPPALPVHGSPAKYISLLTGHGFLGVFALTFVNNSFSVPAASGCGTSGGNLVDASINHKLGLPSPPGQNMILITANAEQNFGAEVLEHGWTGE